MPPANVKRITSRHNPAVARYREAARGGAADLLLLDGAHLVREALGSGLRLQQAAVRSDYDACAETAALVDELERARVDIVSVSATVMDAISPVKSSSPIVALAARPVHDARALYGAPRALVVIAGGVQDPGNLGAIVRVAEAAGATGVAAAGGADPFGWKAIRGSMGSALRLPIVAGSDLPTGVADARRHGCRIVAAAPRGGRSPFNVDLTAPTAIVVGGEGQGLPSDIVDAADERVTIPMQAPVESLNTAVTAALIVYEARRQRSKS